VMHKAMKEKIINEKPCFRHCEGAQYYKILFSTIP
jgi:hypothetical protein